MSDGLKFKTEVINEHSMVSMARENGFVYVNAVTGDHETRIRFTEEAFIALVKLHLQFDAHTDNKIDPVKYSLYIDYQEKMGMISPAEAANERIKLYTERKG